MMFQLLEFFAKYPIRSILMMGITAQVIITIIQGVSRGRGKRK